MIISKDGYCSNGCHENKAKSLGFVDATHFIMCPKCGEKYGFDTKGLKVGGESFNVWYTKASLQGRGVILN